MRPITASFLDRPGTKLHVFNELAFIGEPTETMEHAIFSNLLKAVEKADGPWMTC